MCCLASRVETRRVVRVAHHCSRTAARCPQQSRSLRARRIARGPRVVVYAQRATARSAFPRSPT
eukprot:3258369-Lingulodinium_polyedra.AAC.1